MGYNASINIDRVVEFQGLWFYFEFLTHKILFFHIPFLLSYNGSEKWDENLKAHQNPTGYQVDNHGYQNSKYPILMYNCGYQKIKI
jgi:hypothetical protein